MYKTSSLICHYCPGLAHSFASNATAIISNNSNTVIVNCSGDEDLVSKCKLVEEPCATSELAYIDCQSELVSV